MSVVAQKKNPIKIMLVIVIVLILALIAIQLFVKSKVQLSNGTTGRVGVFGNLELDESTTPTQTQIQEPVI